MHLTAIFIVEKKKYVNLNSIGNHTEINFHIANIPNLL